MNTASWPVFVIGPEGSGTNLLALGIGQLPHISIVLDCAWFGVLIADIAAAHDATINATRRSPLRMANISRDQFLHPFAPALDKLVWKAVGLSAMGDDPSKDRSAASDGSPGSMCQRRRWVDGAPDNTFLIPALRALFPDARFVYLSRDKDQVVAALENRLAPDGSCYTDQTAAAHWRHATEVCQAAESVYGPDIVHRMEFADLICDPAEAMRGCLTFLGEEYDDACVRPMTGLDPHIIEPNRNIACARVTRSGEQAGPSGNEERILERAYLTRIRSQRKGGGEWSLTERVHHVIRLVSPEESTVLVINRGDEALLAMDDRTGWHFPRDASGSYAGYYPATSADAIEHLEGLRSLGAEYLVIPSTSFWWLEHYDGFQTHLDSHYRVKWHDEWCVIYEMAATAREGAVAHAP